MAKEETYLFPSRYGSHKSMVIKEDGEIVTCKDEYGEYKTSKDRLDTGGADPNRYASSRDLYKSNKVKKDKD